MCDVEESHQGERLGGFDSILTAIGDYGVFQKRFTLIYNLLFTFFASMPVWNIIIALSIPDHWCSVPGRELTNYTFKEWKALTIPEDIENSYKACRMFNISIRSNGILNDTFEEIDCQYGWEYDKTWFKSTAATEYNWVCEKDTYVANIFAVSRLGEGIGAFIFGHLGDNIGRKTVLYLTIVVCVFGRCLSAFTASTYIWFLILSLIGSLATNAIITAPLIISMEISSSKERAHISMLQNVAWTFCTSFLPLLYWVLQDWVLFMLLSTLPCVPFLFLNKYIVESPRWLASTGKTARALKELEKIAKVNGTKVPDDAGVLLRVSTEKPKQKSFGVMSLFSSWGLAKNTLLLVTAWSIVGQVYFTLIFNVNNIGGNPYLNYFLQGVSELPAYLVGNYCTNRIGRKWSYICSFLLTSFGSILITFTVTDPSQEYMTTILAFIMRFTITFTLFAVNLQAMEIYPTCVRQSGTAFNSIVASIFSSLSAYVVYWGTKQDEKVPFIVSSVLCIIGALCGLFLPETLNKKLPETLADGEQFGADQSLWIFPWKDSIDKNQDLKT